MKNFRLNDYFKSKDEIVLSWHEVESYHFAHCHEFIEIAYIASGNGTQTINDKTERIKKGDIFLLDSGAIHEFKADEGHPLKVFNCIFTPYAVNAALKNKGFISVAYEYLLHSLTVVEKDSSYIKLSEAHLSGIDQIIFEMHDEYSLRKDGSNEINKANLVRLLIHIFRLYKYDLEKKQSPIAYNKLIADNAICYMKEHYSEKITCETLAKTAYLSESHFRKLFKEVTGSAVMQTLREIRIKNSCKLLKETNLPIEDIAFRVGYNDVKSFYESFIKQINITPAKYRKNS